MFATECHVTENLINLLKTEFQLIRNKLIELYRLIIEQSMTDDAILPIFISIKCHMHILTLEVLHAFNATIKMNRTELD